MCEIPLSEPSIDPKKEKRNGEKMSKKRKENNKSYITFHGMDYFLITYVFTKRTKSLINSGITKADSGNRTRLSSLGS